MQIGNKFSFGCEVFQKKLFLRIPYSVILVSAKQYKMTEVAQIQKIPGYSSDFLIGMNALRTMGTLCDVTIEVEGQSFLAHRNVLALSSGYFQRIFSNDMPERVQIYGIKATAFNSILDFIYTGNIEINKENVVHLWITFDHFAIFNVKARETCDISLIEEFKKRIAEEDVDSFLDLWKIRNRAYAMGKFRLVAVVEKLIGSDWYNLIMRKEFLELKSEDLCDLIGSDNLVTETEETIFEAGMNWIKFREEERIKFLPEIFAKIRLDLLSRKFLTEIVDNERLIKDSEHCRNLILHDLNGKNESSRSRSNKQTGKIYVIGGLWNEGRMEKYDPNESACFREEGIPMPSERIEMGGSVLNGKIYIVGGCAKDDSYYVSAVEVFDPETKKWSERCDIPEFKCFPAVTASKDLIYVCGGYNTSGVLNSVHCFKPDTNNWLTIPPMKKHRKNASAVMLNDFIYVMGGIDSNDDVLNSVERFDPKKNCWEEVKPMSIKRAKFGTAILEGKIYVCGGENKEETFEAVEVYDSNQDIWELIKPMSSKRTGLAVVSNMGKIWAIGGSPIIEDDIENDYQAHDNVEVYDPDTKKWTVEELTEMREDHVACVVN